MADDSGAELHDTVQADLPEDLRDKLPQSVQDRDDLRVADDAMSATVNPSDTRDVPLVDEETGEVFVVTMTDISWAAKNDVFTNSLKKTGPNDGKLDFAHYYREVAKETIVEVEPQPENLTTWLQGLKSRFGSQLEEHLPAPVSDLEEGREEN